MPCRWQRYRTHRATQHPRERITTRTVSRTGSGGGVGGGGGRGGEAAVLDFGARERHQFQSPPRHLLLQKLSHALPTQLQRYRRAGLRPRLTCQRPHANLYAGDSAVSPHRVPLPLELEGGRRVAHRTGWGLASWSAASVRPFRIGRLWISPIPSIVADLISAPFVIRFVGRRF
ncbi:hypothetical protein BHE74_00027083 [Ensete ventricosum]|nr:hypothetical protein GW17_00014939 [Ensete ventricosum]RWW65603.1 hypothetical protein BHE74_00027083 [Ensete ventricosum]RZS06025.1 hypothetical protein BHM03_00036606 [Ensete ventricosum]